MGYSPFFSGGCFETGNGQSKMYTTDDESGTMITRFWDNNDCSGDPYATATEDDYQSCLFDDGECVVAVEPTESPTNSPTGSPTPGPTSDPDGDDDDDDDDDDKNKWWGRGRPRHDDKKKL